MNFSSKILYYVLAVVVLLLAGCAGKKQVAPPAEPLRPKPADQMSEEAYHHFTNGVIYEQEGLVEEAAREYEQALTYEPLAFDIRMALGQLYLAMNRPSQALDTFLPIADKTSETYRLIGDCFRTLKQDVEAESAYKRAWQSDSTNVALNYQLGVYAARANRFDEAARYMRSAAAGSGNAELFSQIAQMYSELKMYDSAAVVIESALRLSPNDPTLYSRLAVYHYNGGKIAESKAALHRGIDAVKTDARLVAQLIETFNAEGNVDSMRVYGEKLATLEAADNVAFERIGIVLRRAGLEDVAERVYRKLLERDTTNRYALFYLGRICVERQDWFQARGYFDRLIASDSTMPDGWTNLALIEQQQQRPDSALHILEMALGVVATERDNIKLFYAQVLSQTSRGDSAIVVLKQILAEGGDSVRALFQLGAELEKQKDYDAAARAFEQILTIEPEHHPTLNFLGYMLADRGIRLEESLNMIERALKAEPENGAYLDSYAWALHKLGRNEEALIQIQKAVKVTNNDPIVIEHLGDIQFALGHLESARDAWKTALAFDPGNKTLQDKLNR